MAAWEKLKELAEKLEDYSRHHCYTEWESEQLEQISQDLLGLTTALEDEIKQAKRTAGGLSNKVQRQGATIKGLEDRLEELEAETARG
jgi:chromosome segregation ATPase